MTKKDVAIKCVHILMDNRSKQGVERVLSYINGLEYSKSGEPIPQSLKLAIVEEMIECLPEVDVILEHSDNSSILQLIQAVKAKLEGK